MKEAEALLIDIEAMNSSDDGVVELPRLEEVNPATANSLTLFKQRMHHDLMLREPGKYYRTAMRIRGEHDFYFASAYFVSALGSLGSFLLLSLIGVPAVGQGIRNSDSNEAKLGINLIISSSVLLLFFSAIVVGSIKFVVDTEKKFGGGYLSDVEMLFMKIRNRIDAITEEQFESPKFKKTVFEAFLQGTFKRKHVENFFADIDEMNKSLIKASSENPREVQAPRL